IFGPYAGPAADLGFEIIGNLTGKPLTAEAKENLHKRLVGLIPSEQRRAKVEEAVLEKGDVLVGPGRYYVDGLLVENHEPILYSEQAGAPFGDGDLTPDDFKNYEGRLLLYLDVWERDVTYLEDDHIREVALGGPDTCGRAQVFWQVRLLRNARNDDKFTCSAVDALRRQAPGRLRARTVPAADSTELCVIAPDSRYRGENQLYRVEVHQSGQPGKAKDSATFMWSRDNGSRVFPI